MTHFANENCSTETIKLGCNCVIDFKITFILIVSTDSEMVVLLNLLQYGTFKTERIYVALPS